MAFSRKALKAMGLTDEQVESLIELHSESLDAVKAERDDYKDKADKLTEVQEQLKTVKAELDTAKKDDYKGKYESERDAHNKLKEEIKTKETTAKKSSAFKAMLKEKGYSDNAINKITKYGGYVDGIELDENGQLKEADKLIGSIEKEWSEYKPEVKVHIHTPNVPDQANGKAETSKAAQIWADYNKRTYGDNVVTTEPKEG